MCPFSVNEHFEFDKITLETVYGSESEKFVNERLMGNAHYIILVRFF